MTARYYALIQAVLVVAFACSDDSTETHGGEAGADSTMGGSASAAGGASDAGNSDAGGRPEGSAGSEAAGTAGTDGSTEAGGNGGEPGATVNAGSGGASSIPDPSAGAPNLDDCELVEKQDRVDGCTLGYRCAEKRVTAGCALIRGELRCDCSSGFTTGDLMHTIHGVEGLAACEVMIDVCHNPLDPQRVSPEECTPDLQSAPIPDCDGLHQSCERTFTTADGVEGTLTRDRTLQCAYNDPPFPLSCTCDEKGYGIHSSTPSCGAILDNCRFGLEFDDGSIECDPSETTLGENSCYTAITCRKAADPNGYLWVGAPGRWARCQRTAQGETRCECTHSAKQLWFRTDLPVADGATCERMVEACAHIDDLELSGTVDCATTEQSMVEDRCGATVSCTQEATLGSETIRAEGAYSVACAREGGAWSCNCSARNETVDFQGEGENAGQACANAVDLCPDLLDIPIGVPFTE